MPREIVLAPPGSVTGLLFRPLPEMSLLHVGAPSNTSLALSPAAGWMAIEAVDGLHCHLLVTLIITDFATVVSLEIRAGPKADALGSVMLNISRGMIKLGRPTPSQPYNFPATLGNSTVVKLEIFVDGAATEVFANGGERALTQSAQVMSIEGDAIKATVTNGTASLEATTWAMKKSVEIS